MGDEVRAGQVYVSEYNIHHHVLATYEEHAWVLLPDLPVSKRGLKTMPRKWLRGMSLHLDLSDEGQR